MKIKLNSVLVDDQAKALHWDDRRAEVEEHPSAGVCLVDRRTALASALNHAVQRTHFVHR
ncbi:MAG: hypothetical protein GY722_26290 [bacterium]|nr:hypothetical protein [bacterium]